MASSSSSSFNIRTEVLPQAPLALAAPQLCDEGTGPDDWKQREEPDRRPRMPSPPPTAVARKHLNLQLIHV